MSAQVGNAHMAAAMAINNSPSVGIGASLDLGLYRGEPPRSAARGIVNAVLLSAPIWALFGFAIYLWV